MCNACGSLSAYTPYYQRYVHCTWLLNISSYKVINNAFGDSSRFADIDDIFWF